MHYFSLDDYEGIYYGHFSSREMLRGALHVYPQDPTDGFSRLMLEQLISFHMTSVVRSSVTWAARMLQKLCQEMPLGQPVFFSVSTANHAIGVELTRHVDGKEQSEYRSRVFNTAKYLLSNPLDGAQLEFVEQNLIIPYTEFRGIRLEDLQAASYHAVQERRLMFITTATPVAKRVRRTWYSPEEFQPAKGRRLQRERRMDIRSLSGKARTRRVPFGSTACVCTLSARPLCGLEERSPSCLLTFHRSGRGERCRGDHGELFPAPYRRCSCHRTWTTPLPSSC